MNKQNESTDPLGPMTVGGQAVIEGVMMRAPGMIATAVRRADGTITVRREAFVSITKRVPFLKYPLLRGALGIVEMLVVGIRTLNFSAEVAMADEVKASGQPGTTDSISSTGEHQSSDKGQSSDNGPSNDKLLSKDKHPSGGKLMLGVTVTVAFALAIVLFFITPLVLTSAVFSADQSPLLFNLLAGAIRLTIFLAYLLAISRMRDVQRLFAYHGAEHKAVFAYEGGRELTVESARTQSRFHPRCGTSFLLVVMVSAIAVFALLDGFLLMWLGNLTLGMRLVTHLPLIPLVGGVSYELIRLSARHAGSWWGSLLVAPGLWLQAITTREPDERQLEVALAALQSALAGTEESVNNPPSSALAGAA
jgi:uncharacterized protein YqhQ